MERAYEFRIEERHVEAASEREPKRKILVPVEPADQPLVNSALAQYEDLPTDLLIRCSNAATKTLLFTGTDHGDGVSTTAARFANTISRDPQLNILLIDANLRNPTLHKLFQVRTADTDTLLNALAYDAVGPITPTRRGALYLLPSGGKLAQPATLFRSEAFERLLHCAREKFDLVIIDVPPVHHFPEARILSGKVDGVVLVVEAGRTRRRAAVSAKSLIEDAGGRLLGVVLNKVKYYIPEWIYKRI